MPAIPFAVSAVYLGLYTFTKDEIKLCLNLPKTHPDFYKYTKLFYLESN